MNKNFPNYYGSRPITLVASSKCFSFYSLRIKKCTVLYSNEVKVRVLLLLTKYIKADILLFFSAVFSTSASSQSSTEYSLQRVYIGLSINFRSNSTQSALGDLCCLARLKEEGPVSIRRRNDSWRASGLYRYRLPRDWR